jgi:O-antigen/teichoic acid export membrane protein
MIQKKWRMSTGKRIIKNSIFLILSQFFSKIFNLGLILVLTRLLGKTDFGLYSFSFSYVSLFVFLTHLGIINLLVREIARNKEEAKQFLGNTFPAVLLLSGGFLVIVNIIPFFLQWSYTERLITVVFGFYFIFDVLGHYFFGVARAFERMEYQAIISIIERFLLLISGLVAWYFAFSLITVVILFTFIIGLKAYMAYKIVIQKFVSFTPKLNFDFILPILKEAYPFALVGLFLTVSVRIDLIMLKGFHSADAVAVYSVARKIIESLSFVPESIYYAVFPALSVLYLTQTEKFTQTFQKTFIIMTVIAVPLASGLFVLAPRFINLLFEPEFSDAGLALRWLSIAFFIMFIRISFTAVFNSAGKQHLFAVYIGISTAINILLNLLLIPKYNILGASISAIVSEFTVVLIAFPRLLKYVNFYGVWTQLIKLVLAAVLIFIFINLIQSMSVTAIIIFTGIIYFLLVLILQIVSYSDLKEFILLIINKYKSQSLGIKE